MESKVKSDGKEVHISYDLDMRLALLIQNVLGNKNDWTRLEKMTGIKAVRWRHFYSGATKPSADMLEFFFIHYPQYAFWLATGLTDYEAGHIAPQVNLAFPGILHKGLVPLPTDYTATESYFKKCLDALELCWNRWMGYVRQRSPEKEIDRDSVLTLYKLGINTSIQLGASEATTALGEQQQASLLEEISHAQEQHLKALASRLGQNWEKAGPVIDLQRGLETKAITELREDQQSASDKTRK
uniref:hypothetical protein n=1 Tax=Castellaniella defragrans TaxID=75697 RepID=UPI00333F6CF9